ncbi:MAG: hypothetical protein IJN74_00050 [Clostridia bacterium]|nr:hypothetical protein [Clostridia bacterium]
MTKKENKRFLAGCIRKKGVAAQPARSMLPLSPSCQGSKINFLRKFIFSTLTRRENKKPFRVLLSVSPLRRPVRGAGAVVAFSPPCPPCGAFLFQSAALRLSGRRKTLI